jgi:predicted Zn-dependent protease
MGMTDTFEAMLAAGQDTPLLRFGLGAVYYKAQDWPRAVAHLREAVGQDPGYSAAWKLLGRCLLESGDPAQAMEALDRGISVAESKGDIQAAKEMRVFRRRAEKQAGGQQA